MSGFVAGCIVGGLLGLYGGIQIGGWRAVLRISQVAHRDLMGKAGLRKR